MGFGLKRAGLGSGRREEGGGVRRKGVRERGEGRGRGLWVEGGVSESGVSGQHTEPKPLEGRGEEKICGLEKKKEGSLVWGVKFEGINPGRKS